MSSARRDLSPKCLSNIIGVGNERPIVIDGANVNLDVDGDLVTEVQCTYLTCEIPLLDIPGIVQGDKAARVIAPTFTWE